MKKTTTITNSKDTSSNTENNQIAQEANNFQRTKDAIEYTGTSDEERVNDEKKVLDLGESGNTQINHNIINRSNSTKISKGLFKTKEMDRFKPPVGVIVLVVVNIIILSMIAFLLVSIPKKAKEVKEQRNTLVSSITLSDIQNAKKDIEINQGKIDRLNNVFPNDSGLIDFVKEIEVIKESGVLMGFSFANKKAIKDSIGYYGIPIVVDFTGTWETISRDLEKFERLPYLIRPIRMEVGTTIDKEEKVMINLKYGVFLYVDESFGKD